MLSEAASVQVSGDAAACEGGSWVDPRLPELLGHRVLHPSDAPSPEWLSGSEEASAELH